MVIQRVLHLINGFKRRHLLMMSFMQLATVLEMDLGLQNANAYTIRG